MSSLKAGSRLKSAVCDAEVMVVRAAEGDFRLCCGGAEMIALATAQRFEFLCTKGGKGTLSLDGEVLTVKQAKALPSSD